MSGEGKKRVFFDSNVIVYAQDSTAPWKRDKAGRLMTEGLDGVIRFVRISDKGRGGK